MASYRASRSYRRLRLEAGILGVVTALIVSACGGSSTSTTNASHPATTSAVGGLPPLPGPVTARGRFIIGVKCDFPPFGYLDAQGHHAGYDVQVAQRLADLAFHDPNRVSYVCVTTTNRTPVLQSGQVDMIIATLSWSKDRATTIDYSTPYYGATGRLLVRASGGITSLADLRGKTVVTTRGSVYVTWAQTCLKNSSLSQLDGMAAGVTAVADGQASGFIFDDAFLLGAVTNNPALKLTPDKFLSIPWGVGVRSNQTTLLTWIDGALAQMKAGDEFYRILQSNIPASDLPSFADQVPRPQITLSYPSAVNPATNCGA